MREGTVQGNSGIDKGRVLVASICTVSVRAYYDRYMIMERLVLNLEHHIDLRKKGVTFICAVLRHIEH